MIGEGRDGRPAASPTGSTGRFAGVPHVLQRVISVCGPARGEKIRVASEFKPYKMLYAEPTFSMIGG